MNTSQIYATLGKLVVNGKELEKLSTANAQWLFKNPKQAMSLLIKSIELGSCLRPIKDKKRFVIPACDGTKSFSDAQNIVVPSQDKRYYYCADETGLATKQIEIERYNLVKRATLIEIFSSFGRDLSRLLFTPHQIISFADENRKFLFEENASTAFLFNSGISGFGERQLLVASIFFHSAEGYPEDIPWINMYPFAQCDPEVPVQRNIVIPARKR